MSHFGWQGEQVVLLVADVARHRVRYLRGVRHEVVEQRLHGEALGGSEQVVLLVDDVLGHVRAAQELRHLLAEVVAVVLQQAIRRRSEICNRYLMVTYV